ncbi:MAG: hypothetical protein J0I98_11450 [Mesorhizobium sp.]|nr:hypothetical protein [Mesorhizobium sp.]MBN9243399.1 hypothetical protein [Mesorhizobium sp.]
MKNQANAIRVPAHLRPYVDVLGVDAAVEFFLAFGGGYAYFSRNPEPQSPIAAVIGVEHAAALGRSTGGGTMRVPTAKPFIAGVLRERGLGTSAIARKLHMSEVAVRRWFADDPRQLKLFEPTDGD